MTHKVGKLEAASHQLDWAIRLLIDFNAPIPAITLARAAEGVLSGAIERDIKPTLDRETPHDQLKHGLAAQYQIKPKDVNNEYLNRSSNWLKHWDKSEDNEYEIFDLRHEAVQMIARGISNMLALNQSQPSEGPRFLEWIEHNLT